MGLTEYALTQALLMTFRHIDKSDIVLKTADELDKLADDKLGAKGSEKVQERIVTQILLPMARQLMKENHDRYIQILEAEQHGFLGDGGVQEGGAESGQRQNFSPK